MTDVRIADWYIGRKAVWAGEYPNRRRHEFDCDVESDGQLWVYVYTSTWAAPDRCNGTTVRRIPMGEWRTRHRHVDYPHQPGTLFDCPACEAECTCGAAGDCVACQTCRVCGADLTGHVFHHGECPSHADEALTESLIGRMLANPLIREVTL